MPRSLLEGSLLNRAIEWYRETLQLFGHTGLPKFTSPRPFTDRADPLLLMLTKECPNLHTLIIRERVSTCTLLLIADAGRKQLRDIFIRKNAVILRCDWPISPEWTKEYRRWLKSTSQSYTATEKEIGKILGKPWKMFSDKDFIKLNPRMF